MKLTRFPRLGVAGGRLALVVLLGGCSGLTNAPARLDDGGRDGATLDGAGSAETGPPFDGADSRQIDDGQGIVEDVQPAVPDVSNDLTGPIPGLDATVAADTGDGGRVLGDAADAARAPDTRIPVDEAGGGPPDVVMLIDVSTGDDRNEPEIDAPGEDAGVDSTAFLADVGGRDLADAYTAPPDVATTPLTVNAGTGQTTCVGWPVSVGSPAHGGTPPYSYAWSATPTCPACISDVTLAQPTATVDVTTKFTVTVRDSLGAVATSSVTITVDSNVADSGPEATVDPGASVRIGTIAKPGYSYSWTCDRPTCGLSNATVAQPTVIASLSTQYTVTVTTPGSCTGSDSTIVWVNLPISTTPADGEPAYPDSAALVVQFGASVLASSIKSSGGAADTVTLRETVSGAPVVFTTAYNPALQAMTITPTGSNYNATVGRYTLTLVGGADGIVSDDSLRPQRLPSDVVVHFTLVGAPDVTPPAITYRNPAQGATGAATNTSVVVTFSEPIDPGTASLTVSTGGPGSANLAGALSYDPTTATLTFVPAAALANFTTYTVRLAGIKDLAGNTASPPSWTFATSRTPDTTAPTVASVSPVAGATKVLLGSTVDVTFSEPVAPPTAAAGVQVTAGTNSVTGIVNYDPTSRIASFIPSSPLASQTLYTVTVTGVTDLAGNAMTAPFTSTFTTAKVLFTDSFESGTASWTWPATSTWGLTTDQYVSPTHSLTDSPGGNYAPNVDASAVSSVIDVSGVGSVSFSYWLSGQTQPPPGGDALRVDYSPNGGAAWTNLANWSGTLSWAQHFHTITLPPGTTGLQVRFRFTSNGNQQFDGVYIDDVVVQAL